MKAETLTDKIAVVFMGALVGISFFALLQIYRMGQLNNLHPSVSRNEVLLKAQGKTGAETMELYINKTKKTQWQLTREMQYYTYIPKELEQVGSLEVRLRNQKKADHVVIDYIQIDGEKYQTEDSATKTSGVHNKNRECTEGFHKTQELHCTGWVQYDVPQGVVIGGRDPQYELLEKK